MANEQSDESRPAEVQATVLSRIPLSIGGRSGYSCNYVFPVDEEQHTGSDRADSRTDHDGDARLAEYLSKTHDAI